jgi:hypothetical protein
MTQLDAVVWMIEPQIKCIMKDCHEVTTPSLRPAAHNDNIILGTARTPLTNYESDGETEYGSCRSSSILQGTPAGHVGLSNGMTSWDGSGTRLHREA